MYYYLNMNHLEGTTMSQELKVEESYPYSRGYCFISIFLKIGQKCCQIRK